MYDKKYTDKTRACDNRSSMYWSRMNKCSETRVGMCCVLYTQIPF